jgi:hypothetical protein
MTPEPDGVAVNLAAALNEERRRRREAEARLQEVEGWASWLHRLVRVMAAGGSDRQAAQWIAREYEAWRAQS